MSLNTYLYISNLVSLYFTIDIYNFHDAKWKINHGFNNVFYKACKNFFFNILNVSQIYFYRNRNRFHDFILINHDPGLGKQIVDVVLSINSLLSIFKYV